MCAPTLAAMSVADPIESSLDIPPLAHAAGTVALPGSKSISNRTLLLSALATGATRVRGLLDADDVDRMLDALVALGVRIDRETTGARVCRARNGRRISGRGVQSCFSATRGRLFVR